MERYLDCDLEDIYLRNKTFDDIAKKYNSTPDNVLRAYYRRGFNLKRRYYIVYNLLTNTKNCYMSISECARALNVSRNTIYRYLKGTRIKLFENIGVKVEEHYG